MKKMMKQLLVWGGVIGLLFSTACSDEYDDSKLRDEIEDLTNRIENLEAQARITNSNLETLHSLLQTLQGNLFIAKVEETDNGYTIYFTDGSKATITNGEAGEDAPTIGVEADEDGFYYWTITSNGVTEWLTDGSGNKLRADAVRPVLGIDSEGYWTISYDGGKSYERILDADNNPVEAIDNIFSDAVVDGDWLKITLADGQQISVPIRSDFYLLITDAPEMARFNFGQTRTFAIEKVGVDRVVVTKPDEWKVTLTDTELTITAPTAAHKDCADLSGEVSIIYFSANYMSSAISLKVQAEEPKNIAIAVTGTGLNDDGATISATFTPDDNEMLYYYGEYRTATEADPDDLEAVLGTFIEALNMTIESQGWDAVVRYNLTQGPKEYTAKWLYEDQDYYVIAFGVEKVEKEGVITAAATTQLFRSEKIHTPKTGGSADGAIDLSANGTSNSYIVTEASTKYKFNAKVMGNGATTTGITPTAIAPKKAILLWETGTVKNAIIKELELNDEGYVVFTTGETMDGNALIAVTDGVPVEGELSEGTILWSWHIWATDYTAEKDKKVVNIDGKEFMMMDVNLGEWSDKYESYSSGYWGLKYQWGRKDPMISLNYSGTTPDGACVTHYENYTWGSGYPSADDDAGTLLLATQYPMTFCKGNYATDNDWYGISDTPEHRNNNLWGNPEGDMTKAVKTIYDPCPAGYKVAPIEAISGFFKTGLESTSITSSNINSSGSFSKGYNFITSGTEYTYFPAAGSMTGSSGSIGKVGYTGMYFTSTPVLEGEDYDLVQVRGLRVESTCMLPQMNRAEGCSVRCVRE